MTKPYAFCPLCSAAMVVRHDGERDRRACSACAFIHYDNPLPVVAAIVETAEGVVLVRNVGWPEKMFGLVTGFLERGETPEDGVLREIREELGVVARKPTLIGVYAFAERNELLVAFHVEADGPFVLSSELAGHKIVPKARLKPWPFGTGQAVADWLARTS